jgi:Na+:H+ antiporter, NhaA family
LAFEFVMTGLFKEFFESEKAGSVVLICCTLISLLISNSFLQDSYLALWSYDVAGHSISHWINDGLMAIFFLLIGLELEREVYVGELSTLKKASLPIVAALGGMIVPASIFLLYNYGTKYQDGAGIPMATDIAFAIGVLSLLGNRVPVSLKVFLTALAVIDDLGAILIIAFFYTTTLSFLNLGIALGVFAVLLILNRLKIYNLIPYLIGGVVMWYFMLHSGVHATITGVMLAFAIPFGKGDEKSISYRLQKHLHMPVSFFILPVFALANTALVIDSDWASGLSTSNSMGILSGLVVGKPLGIFLFSFVAVSAGISSLPGDLRWKDLIAAGFLGGIGFTMSIFITLLAFGDAAIIDDSKIAILISSLVAGTVGFFLLKLFLKKDASLT